MKETKHLGIYGLILENDKILLVDKVGGPYDGLLDLPGGSMKINEKPMDTLKREMKEETGLNVLEASLFDCDAAIFDFELEGEMIHHQHVGVFYKIDKYEDDLLGDIKIDEVNDDSRGAKFYDISSLTKDRLSKITIIELEKLGYEVK